MRDRKVVYATDFTGDVKRGLELATRLAAERAATLVVLHVVPFDPSEGEGLLHRAAAFHDEPGRRLAGLVPDDPGVPYLHVLELGDPEACIAGFAERERVDLLVMEARPHHPLRRALGRSLVERLLGRVPCPLVTFRPAPAPAPPARPRSERAALRPEVLTTLLNARVDALLSLLHLREEAALGIAASSSVRDGIAGLYRAERYGADRCLTARMRELLELELAEHQRALGAIGLEVIAGGAPLVQLGVGARHDAAWERFARRVEERGSAVSVLLEPTDPRGDVECVTVAATMQRLADLDVVLAVAFDSRRNFLRILGQPGPVTSAETYAFDRDGMMLSNSRFPDQLRQAGLLPPDPGAQAAGRVRLCDPSVEQRPLTRMAAAATAGIDGCDWSGYRDYRGVEVVGAWRWLEEVGFGVAVEMDRARAASGR